MAGCGSSSATPSSKSRSRASTVAAPSVAASDDGLTATSPHQVALTSPTPSVCSLRSLGAMRNGSRAKRKRDVDLADETTEEESEGEDAGEEEDEEEGEEDDEEEDGFTPPGLLSARLPTNQRKPYLRSSV